MTITGSGTNTVVGAIPATTSSVGLLPVLGAWSASPSLWTTPGLGTIGGSDLFPIGGDLRLQVNSTDAFVLSLANTSSDALQWSPFLDANFPALAVDDTYGFVGATTYILTGGKTFADFTLGEFNNTGLNGGNFIYRVIPEPTSALLLASGAFGALMRRQR
ncbi:MAG: PEP-CTERM sorting domain-containing protein [Verrucomicrobiota bacterium]